MESKTHLRINPALCGEIVKLSEGTAETQFVTTEAMRADEQGLIHGGFIFGLADYAAMLAVNDPNVVLGSADIRFTAPVRCGDTVRAHAQCIESKGKKRILKVSAKVDDREVLSGTLTAFVLERHVLNA